MISLYHPSDAEKSSINLGHDNFFFKGRSGREGMTVVSVLLGVDQLANLHFHFTSVPRCTPMTSGVEVQRNTDGDTPSMLGAAVEVGVGSNPTIAK